MKRRYAPPGSEGPGLEQTGRGPGAGTGTQGEGSGLRLRSTHPIGLVVRLAAAAAVVLGIAAAGAPLASSDPPPLATNGAIAYDCGSGNSGICLINPDGSGKVQVASTGVRPRWSPDGTKLTFSDGGDIYVMNPDGTDRTQLTTSGEDFNPSFSFDGTHILYESFSGGDPIEMVNATGNSSQTPAAVDIGGGTGLDPVQSPDGSKLAFDGGSAGSVTVYDGSTQKTLGSGESPAWAPDGSLVYFEFLNGGSWEIDSAKPDGTDEAPVLTGQKENVGVAPDGTELVYANANGGGIETSPISGATTFVVPNAGGGFDPAWQPVSTLFHPTLATHATAGPVTAGTTITDSATLSGAATGAAGTVTFNAYATPDCSGTAIDTETVPVTGGTASATGFKPTQAGTYTWTASYSGDAATDTFGANEACGGAGESTTVVATAAAPWTGSGTGTTTVVSDGTSAAPQFTYSATGSPSSGASGSWTFETTANTAGTFALPYTYSGFHAYFAVTTSLTEFVVDGGVEHDTTLVPLAAPVNCCTPPSGGFDYTGTASFTVQPGDTYGFKMTGSNFDTTDVLQGTLTVGGAENDAWPVATEIPIDANGNGSATGSLDSSGQAAWYRFNVEPGENLNVDLTNLPANYDLTLFSDIGQAFNTLNSSSDLQQLSAEFAPSAFSPSAFSPSAFSPSAFSPSAFSPSAFSPSAFSPSAFSPSAFSPSAFSPSAFSPSAFSGFTDTNGSYESAQTRSAIAISASDGTADEHIVANTWNNTGSFYIRVSGRNGAYDPGAPFNLGVHEDLNSCSTISQPDPTQALLTSPVDPATKTLILADYARMPQGPISRQWKRSCRPSPGRSEARSSTSARKAPGPMRSSPRRRTTRAASMPRTLRPRRSATSSRATGPLRTAPSSTS